MSSTNSTKSSKPQKIEDSSIWKEANALAEFVYTKLPEFPDEERWDSQRKLRTAANELIFNIAKAVTNTIPMGAKYDWSYARKELAALKTMYRFAGRQKFIELDPEIMVRLDHLGTAIDAELASAREAEVKETKRMQTEDLKPWQEKYRLWKEMEKRHD